MDRLDKLIDLVSDHAKLGLEGAKSLYIRFFAVAAIAEMCYRELVKKGEITPIEKLPEQKKRQLWKESLGCVDPKKPERHNIYTRKVYCRAAYLIEVVLSEDRSNDNPF